jgi:hypothetical protein
MLNEKRDQTVREAVRLAELNLTSQLSLMLAADQRATTFSGMIIGALAVVATIYVDDTVNWTDDLGLVILGLSAALAVYSARSVEITVPGNEFKNFSSDLASNREFNTVLADLGRIFDAASAANRATMQRNSKFYNAALVWSVAGFAVSLIPNMFSLASRFLNFVANFG